MGIINWYQILRYSALLIVLAAVVGGAVYAATIADRALSSNAVCTYCHSMSYAAAELKGSPHYGTLGADPNCADCHLPQGFSGRAKVHLVDGARSLYGAIFHDVGTIEKYDAYRAEYAHAARVKLKQWNSSPCRSCHKDPRPFAGRGKEEHLKMKSGKLTCIDCHQNLVHKRTPVENIGEGMRQGKIIEAQGGYLDMQAHQENPVLSEQ